MEYILLLFVMMSLGTMVFKSQAFKNLFGPDSAAFGAMRKRMEYNYRYTLDGKEDLGGTSYQGNHDSYVPAAAGGTRFFSPLGEIE